ncbi:hypothetical protein Taro_011818 [Colocasia esculenta]|uniref:NAC domain-containing protein n=1 Tax=Colocasia esculenta TaxID=4460 RepID=A0A843U2C5_COLES|nr:hypothetical protein [Colocasia esculenta]
MAAASSMHPGNGQLSVPPGFRFHPTDEELLFYYLRKKVSFEPIDLDVIRDVDLNKLEPWDLNDKCRIGSAPQNEWYFFCHKDKKYPTGTRTNRATSAGFWKSTGRDKVINLGGSKKIGMRKTLVFYTGRAPHGQKTDWIMHEFRLDEDNSEIQEDGWVVCRVFKKKTHQRGLPSEASLEEVQVNELKAASECTPLMLERNQHFDQVPYDFSFDGSMHLPQLLSSDCPSTPFMPLASLDMPQTHCSENLMKLTSGGGMFLQHGKLNADWSILEKLLASHQHLDQVSQGKCSSLPSQTMGSSLPVPRFPLQNFGCELDQLLKFAK